MPVQPLSAPVSGYAPPAGFAPAPTPIAPCGQPLASFGHRLGAFIIDGLIVGATSMIFFIPLVGFALFGLLGAFGDVRTVNGVTTAGGPPSIGAVLGVMAIMLLAYAISLGLGYLYYVELALRDNGRTIGKKLLRLRIVAVDPNRTLTRGDIAKRYLAGHVAPLVIPFFSWVDGLWQLWDKPYQQCLHDKFAATVVIQEPAA